MLALCKVQNEDVVKWGLHDRCDNVHTANSRVVEQSEEEKVERVCVNMHQSERAHPVEDEGARPNER